MPVHGQTATLVDSLLQEYKKPKALKERMELLDNLALVIMTTSLEQGDAYGNEMIVTAEKSRDREALVKAYISNGIRCKSYAGIRDYAAKATNFFEEGKVLAQKNKLDKYRTYILVQQAALQLQLTNIESAAKYLDQATALGYNKDDSTIAVLALTRGDIQLARNEKIDAFRSYLSAYRRADSIGNPSLQRQGMLKLADFYASIEDYDKAIDYYVQATKKLQELPASFRLGFAKVTNTKSIGDLYTAKKSYTLAQSYYDESIRIADSLRYTPLKMQGYVGLLNVYVHMKEPQKSMEFMNSEKGAKLKEYLGGLGMYPIADQAYAIIYSEMGKLDSAQKYFDRSAPFFNQSRNPGMKMMNLLQTAYFMKRKGDKQQAINLLLQADSIAKTMGQLEYAIEVNKNLDTLYNDIGEYKQSKIYSAAYYQSKDSLETLNKEKELSQIEADDALQQVQKEEVLREEKRNARNNLQYVAITVGIITVFFLLVLLGMFRVSARTIKTIGFFAFLMFFEFIFLVSKTTFHEISHGEPWIDLLFLIGLAAILVPLHHALEHKLLHYLTTQNKLTHAGDRLKARLARKN